MKVLLSFFKCSTIPDVDCASPPSIINGTVTLSTNATYYGAAALYECFNNYKLDGVSRRLCSEDGTWGHDSPVCVQITCPIPDVNEHLIVNAGKRTVGETSIFTCSKGRNLIGNSTRTCMANGNWAGKNPTCKRKFVDLMNFVRSNFSSRHTAIDCKRPNEIENGRIIVVNEVTTYGGSAEYHCIPQFNRIGPYLRKCMEDGQWSGYEPRCECEWSQVHHFDMFY